jgi:hypothetical protein
MPQDSAALNLSLSKAYEDLDTYRRFILSKQNEIVDLLSTTRHAISQSRELMLNVDRTLRRCVP